MWFNHNLTPEEHSLENIKVLVNAISPTTNITPLLITPQTKLEQLKLKAPVLISTDFSHYNMPDAKQDTKLQMWKKDKLNIDMSPDEPCGKLSLDIFREWSNKNNYKLSFQAYSTSDSPENWWKEWTNTIFKGVSYAAIGAFSGVKIFFKY